MRVASRLRSRLLVAVMAVGSSRYISLRGQQLELEREMKIYIHDAASSLGFNLKTEQEESDLFPFPLVLANLYVTFTDLLHELTTNLMED